LFEFVTVTVYVVVILGDTVIELVVALLLHKYVKAGVTKLDSGASLPAKLFGIAGVPALSVTMSPLQIVPSLLDVPEVSVTLMEGVWGNGLTIIVFVPLAEQPKLVTVTVYVVVILGDTVIELVLEPSLHKYVKAGVTKLDSGASLPAKLFGVPTVPALSVTMSPLHIVPSLLVVPDDSVTLMEGV
jgi:hypothetical protein